MTDEQAGLTLLILSLLLITVRAIAAGETPSTTDKAALLDLKHFLQINNKVNQGPYANWNESEPSPCHWAGITCDPAGRVTGVSLTLSTISGGIFPNFSRLTELARLDLSWNTIDGPIPPDLGKCSQLRHLNLSHNLISGDLSSLAGLSKLETLDLTLNRLEGDIRPSFPALCASLVTLNISINNFSGEIAGVFDGCPNLRSVDLSTNRFHGEVWKGFWRLNEFSVSENNLTGAISPELFPPNCSLTELDLSANGFSGWFPGSIANCSKLNLLNLWGNFFAGPIPSSIGELSGLQTLLIGNNSFDREIPPALLNCTELVFLDLSRNKFGGDIQPIFGQLTAIRFLVLHSNNYTRGIESSGILSLPNLAKIDLSFNNFSAELPLGVSSMPKLQFLILANNDFYGTIPPEYGNITTLQALDLSFNRLTGEIPPSIGNLTSLLWLMLANNQLTGEIPHSIGNCNSLLWLNLANNNLTGPIPSTISGAGRDPNTTFEQNRRDDDGIPAGSGECLAMKRWIPASYPPFNFIYTLMTRKTCRLTWGRILKGYGVFPICQNASSSVRTFAISGYLQLSGNRLSGEIPLEIRRMSSLSLLHLDGNLISGRLPAAISDLPLVVFNISRNNFSGAIPPEIGGLQCLDSLDLSVNNFSGDIPPEINKLTDLNKFNISYNPLLSGEIPVTGQIATFGNDSFLGDPLISFATVPSGDTHQESPPARRRRRSSAGAVAVRVFLALTAAVAACGVLSFIFCFAVRAPVNADPDPDPTLLDGVKRRSDAGGSSSPSTSGDSVQAVRLDKTAFSYREIMKATGNFSDENVIGRGGYGVVYKAVLPDGRHVAVKKLETKGDDGEREFRAEMEVMTGRTGWPHPNLVPLFGWFLSGSEKLLVYEYMEGGSLEEVISDWTRFGWVDRVQAAVGVARALVYLHHDCQPAVVHRDVKASNVLLDRWGKARVTDFGLARVVGPGESHVSTVVAGTVGYVAPEYGHTCRATTKGDVYSFGVLAMELATGRRAVDGREEGLVEWVRRVGREEWRGLRGAVVPVMMAAEERGKGGLEGLAELCGLLRVGMTCTAESPVARPDMREVLALLLKACCNGGGDYGLCPNS